MSAAPGAPSSDAPSPNDLHVDASATVHLRALAREPRPTGSTAAREARNYCAGVLASLGFELTEHPFQYSAAVGELGTPSAGLAMLVVIAAAIVAALGSAAALALAILLVGAALVMLAGRWAARHGILSLPLGRRSGVNLEARRPGTPPRVWLVAHIDSKSQPISLVVRAAGVVLLLLSWIAAVVLVIEEMLGGPRFGLWTTVAAVAVLGAIPVIASLVGWRSPGAVDNASGVASVLGAAELCRGLPVGVLITDAEELGLAGARSWCAAMEGHARAPVLNCDGVDDTGVLTLMWTHPRATRLEQSVRRSVELAVEELRVIPLIPGVLVDGLAFSDAGWECVTLSRGSLATLRRIHTRRDDLERLQGSGIATVAKVLATAARLTVERH